MVSCLCNICVRAIRYDLVIPTRASHRCSNAYNYIDNNAASGGTSGFMFLNLPLPIGVSAGVCPLIACWVASFFHNAQS